MNIGRRHGNSRFLTIFQSEAPQWTPVEEAPPDQLNFELGNPVAAVPQETPQAPPAPKGQGAGEAPTPQADIWQLHGKYLVAQTPDGLLVIDQHIAHQRVLYEEALAHIEAEGAPRQQLLIPLTVELDSVQAGVVRQEEGLLDRIGFTLRAFGGDTYLVDAIPVGLKNWNEGELLFNLLNAIAAEQNPADEGKQALAAAYARQGAVQAGVTLPPQERHHLLTALLQT